MKVNLYLENKNYRTKVSKTNSKNVSSPVNSKIYSHTGLIQYYPSFAGGNILQNFSDNNYFNNPEEQISKQILNGILNNLSRYKDEADIQKSVYIIDKKVNDVKSDNNVTLVKNSSANSVKANIVDIYGASSVKSATAAEGIYLFNNAKASKLNSDRIFLFHNSKTGTVNAKVLWLLNSAECNEADAPSIYLRNNSTLTNAKTDNLFIRDYAQAEKVSAKNIVMKDNSHIKNAFVTGGSLQLSGQSELNNAQISNTKVIIDKNSKIGQLVSDDNINITGKGTIGNIYTKGKSILIQGPVKITGKIVFLNDRGSVVAQKEPYNIYPKLNSGIIENGDLQFIMQKGEDTFIGNPVDSFSAPLEKIKESKLFSSNNDYGIYSNIDSLQNFYSEIRNPIAPVLGKYLTNGNGFITRDLYEDFFNSTLKTLNSPSGGKTFSMLWISNMKLGDKNLADFWLETLGKDAHNLSVAQKTYTLNNLASEQKRLLTDKTVQYWVENILPDLYNKETFSDLYTVQNNSRKISRIITNIKNDNSEFIKNFDNRNFFNDFKSLSINGKNLIDLWLQNSSNPEIKQILKTDRLKKEYIKKLLTDVNSREKIITLTEKEIEQQKLFSQNYKFAEEELIKDEPALNKSEQLILKKFENNADLYNVVQAGVKDINNVEEIEAVLLNILDKLSKEREELSIKAKRDIFGKSSDTESIINASFRPEINSNIDFITNSYVQSLAKLPEREIPAEQYSIKSFENYVSNNSLYFIPLWKNIVADSYDFYNTVLLDRVTHENIKMLGNIDKAKKHHLPYGLNEIISGSYIDTIEKKDFICRYKDDNNFLTMMNNKGINYRNAISELMLIETINENLYINRLNNFSTNITPAQVRENLDIADKYLKYLDKDYPSMSIGEKTRALSSITPEDFNMLNKLALRDWEQNELKNYMSTKFVEIQLEHNINYQGKNITNILYQMNESLNNIKINVQGQMFTLNEIAQNIDRISVFSEKSFKELYFISDNIEKINKNTDSIKANTKAILYTAMENSKFRDPELSNMIKDLIPEAERNSLTVFLGKVEEKVKKQQEEKRKRQLKTIAGLAAMAAAASLGGFVSPDMITGLLGSGVNADAVVSGIKNITSTLNHFAVFKAASMSLKKN